MLEITFLQSLYDLSAVDAVKIMEIFNLESSETDARLLQSYYSKTAELVERDMCLLKALQVLYIGRSVLPHEK